METKSPEILIRDPLVDILTDRCEQILDVDESNPEIIRHSKDGPYKYRNAWFAEVQSVTEAVFIEVLKIDEMPEPESDEDYLERIEALKKNGDTLGRHTGNEDIEDERTVDCVSAEREPIFPDVYDRVMGLEEIDKDDIYEVFDHWKSVRGKRERNHKEDVEVGKKIIGLVKDALAKV